MNTLCVCVCVYIYIYIYKDIKKPQWIFGYTLQNVHYFSFWVLILSKF